MKKHVNLLLQWMVFFAVSFMVAACSPEEDYLDSDGNIKPGVEVPDPEGTIQLSMVCGDDKSATYIDDHFYIGRDFNFSGTNKDCYFVSLGKVNGLGNVSHIPTTGWAKKVAVMEGHAYIAYEHNIWSKNYFYRIYVKNFIVNETGSIIGADIKYQKPFEGKDEAISLETKSLTFPAEGGTQTLVFKNSGIVQFEVETDVPEWCSIKKISTTDLPFLMDGIEITANENSSTNAKNGKITLTTASGKKTILDVTISSKEPYVSLETDEKEISASEQTETLNIQSNVPFDNLSVNSQANWCKAELVDNSAILKNYHKIEQTNKQSTSETRTENNHPDFSYALKLTLDENTSTQPRETIVTISSKDKKVSSSIRVMQKGIVFEVKIPNIGFDKNMGSRTITINTTAKDWEAESSESWCTFSKNGNQITIRVTASKSDRKATISFKGFNTKITVHQSKYAVDDSFNENGIEGTVGYIGDDFRYIYKYVGSSAWSTENVLTGANSMTDGEYNMNIIKKIDFWQDYYPAFLLCEQLNTNGISGWYLPAIEEIKRIKSLSDYSWSSTEYNASQSMLKTMGNRTKQYSGSIYAIHKF